MRTRWNSAYYMLQRIVEQKIAIMAVLDDTSVCSRSKSLNMQLDPTEWCLADETTKILKPFDAATTFMSGENYSTVSLIRPLIYSIKTNFLEPKFIKYQYGYPKYLSNTNQRNQCTVS